MSIKQLSCLRGQGKSSPARSRSPSLTQQSLPGLNSRYYMQSRCPNVESSKFHQPQQVWLQLEADAPMSIQCVQLQVQVRRARPKNPSPLFYRGLTCALTQKLSYGLLACNIVLQHYLLQQSKLTVCEALTHCP
ncbi:hypothetical protein GOP47_0003923 [Adiantum capillus-veneris]|uniref:Uncharacterized protein n=1 Tax=Adiantum capillus-veneris TaxID=13818 RepID=A0A9D4ZPW2_ADICA|nr:hypothetical protein GOP47_0003923 [Adiantum capillus-veneris]